LPEHHIGKWSILIHGTEKVFDSKADALDAVLKNKFGDNILAAGPNDIQYRFPSQISDFSARIRLAYTRKALLGIWLILAVGGIMAILTMQRPSRSTIGFVVIFAVSALIRWFDSFISLRSTNAMVDREMFFRWLRTNASLRLYFKGCFFFLIAVGGLQLLLQLNDQFDNIINLYGAPYAALKSGELWRLFTGPFFHGSPSHFLVNSFYLLLSAPFAIFYFKWWILCVFLVSNAIGAEFQMLFGSKSFDAYLGISPGITGIIMFVAMVGFVRDDFFPKGFSWLLLALTTIAIVSEELITANSATVAHVTGFALGCIFGALWANFCADSASSQPGTWV